MTEAAEDAVVVAAAAEEAPGAAEESEEENDLPSQRVRLPNSSGATSQPAKHCKRKRDGPSVAMQLLQLHKQTDERCAKLAKKELKYTRRALRLQEESNEMQREMVAMMADYFKKKKIKPNSVSIVFIPMLLPSCPMIDYS